MVAMTERAEGKSTSKPGKKRAYRYTDAGRWMITNGRPEYRVPFTQTAVDNAPSNTPVRNLPQHQHDADYFARSAALKLSHPDDCFPLADRYGDSLIRCWRGEITRQWWYWDKVKLHLMRETVWESSEVDHLAGVFEAERAAERLCVAMGLVWGDVPGEDAAAELHPFTAVLAEAEAQGIGADAMPPRLTMEDRQMILDQLAYFGVDVEAAAKLGDSALEELQDDTVTAAWERKASGQDFGNN